MDPIIFDTYLEGATGGVINKIPIICNGYSKSGQPNKCWNIQTAKEIATTSVERRYAASIVLSQNEKQKVIIWLTLHIERINNSRALPMGLLIETKLIWTKWIGVNKLRVN